jgi:hypothetical protein
MLVLAASLGVYGVGDASFPIWMEVEDALDDRMIYWIQMKSKLKLNIIFVAQA